MDFDERCRLEIRFFREQSILAELWVLLATAGASLAAMAPAEATVAARVRARHN